MGVEEDQSRKGTALILEVFSCDLPVPFIVSLSLSSLSRARINGRICHNMWSITEGERLGRRGKVRMLKFVKSTFCDFCSLALSIT